MIEYRSTGVHRRSRAERIGQKATSREVIALRAYKLKVQNSKLKAQTLGNETYGW